MPPEIRIAALDQLADFDRCVDIQIAVWGYSDGDVVPRRVFLLAPRIGGQLLGAFIGDTIVGFAMALPGYRNGQPYLHSHMLAVLPEYRDHGLGRRLKLAQRDDALARGFSLMEWTFDPLQIKNAHLNLHRLGAVARRYHPDFYGPSSSQLQGGLPTDRLYAEWWMRSPHVVARLAGSPHPDNIATRVEVPAAIAIWKQDAAHRALAVDLQTRNRLTLQSAFAAGLAVVDYARDADGNGSFLLGQWPEVGSTALTSHPAAPAEHQDTARQDTAHDPH